MGYVWCIMICLLLKGLFGIAYSIQFACIGQDVPIYCPDENVDSWQKSETGDILAVCESGMPKINKSIHGKIGISSSCNKLSIMNFTKDDAGKYSCFTKKKDRKKFKKYSFEVKLRRKPNVSIMASPHTHIRKGHKLKLICLDRCHHGGSIKTFLWTHNGKILLNKTSSLLFKNADAKVTGEYSCTANNGAADDSVSINVTVTCGPVKPTIIGFKSSAYKIFVQWTPGFDGGFNKQFIVCYRKKSEIDFSFLTVNNSGRSDQSFYISELESRTDYEFKIIANNALGNSTSTKLYSIRTKQKDMKTTHFKQYGLFFIIPVVLLAAIIIMCRCLLKARNKVQNNLNEMDAQPIQGAGIENNIYRFADELPGPSSTSHNIGEVYSFIDRRLQVSGAHSVNYKVSKKDNINQQSEVRDVHNRVVEDNVSKLNYVEVAFDPKMTSKELYIHGAENKTQYVDIDLLAKADPMRSDNENDSVSSARDNHDDDFVSLEEIQKWRINEDDFF